MRDYSFIRLKDNLTDALNVGDSPRANIGFYDVIHLLPNEAYLQKTSYEGGISLQSQFTAELVNCKGVLIKDITNNVFTNEILDEQGNTQIEFEIVNINEDFGNEALILKLYDDFSSYYSNPFVVTEEFKELTSYFQYKNYNDFVGIPYTNSSKYQSIRLKTYYLTNNDLSEIEDYYQISRGNTISARVLHKSVEKYTFDYIDNFTYIRTNILLQHDIVYLDGVKLTNKTSFESGELIDQLNQFEANYEVYKDYKDKLSYQYQIFEGFDIEELTPFGIYTLSNLEPDINCQFNVIVQLNIGTLRLYDSSDNSLIHSFNQEDIIIDGGTNIDIGNGISDYITTNGSYYILFDAGLISSTLYGIEFEGISDPTFWTFTVQDAEYDDTEYNNEQYLT